MQISQWKCGRKRHNHKKHIEAKGCAAKNTAHPLAFFILSILAPRFARVQLWTNGYAMITHKAGPHFSSAETLV